MRSENLYLIALVVAVITIGVVAAIQTDNGKKYTIETEHGKYYTNQFRMCGKGIAFDTDSKRVIVLGNFNIISNLEQ